MLRSRSVGTFQFGVGGDILFCLTGCAVFVSLARDVNRVRLSISRVKVLAVSNSWRLFEQLDDRSKQAYGRRHWLPE